MTNTIKNILYDEQAGATLEVVIVTAVLIAISLLFNDKLREYAKSLFDAVFNNSIIDRIQI